MPATNSAPSPRTRACRARVTAVALAAVALLGGPTARLEAVDGLTATQAAIQRLVAQSGADVAVAFRTLDGGVELFVQADTPFHAASTMKVPVMVELFRQAHNGTLRLDDPMPVTNYFHSIVDGSGYMLDVADDSDAKVYAQVGKTMTPRALCEAMITVSSNLATNILIATLGVDNIQRGVGALGATGMQVLRGVEDNKAFQKGLNNTTTARGLFTILWRLARGEAVDAGSDREMVDVLARQQFNDRIPAGLPSGTRVAHKTGEITKISHDAAIVYSARPFVLVVLVRGLEDQKRSAALTADITRLLYDATNRRASL